MKKTSRPNPSRFLLLFAFAGALRLVAAVTPTEWQHRQALDVAAPGLVKVPLPASTFDAAQPGLADLRVLDAAGQETPYLLDRELSDRKTLPVEAETVRPRSFRTTRGTDSTQLFVETGIKGEIDSIQLVTAAPFFFKAAHVDISADGTDWQSLGGAVAIFRQFGVEELRISLGRRQAAFIRVTLDDVHSRPIEFWMPKLQPVPEQTAPPLTPLGAEITRRDEFAGETVLTVTLDGSHVPLAELGFTAKEPVFMRRVEVKVRDFAGSSAVERLVGYGSIYRVAIDGTPTRAQLAIPLNLLPATRELFVHIYNLDSPPLAVDGVQAKQHPVNLLFMAASAGTNLLLSGNPQATEPRYDLSAFAGEMRTAAAATTTPGPIQDTPGYRPRESLATAPLPDIPLSGALFDAGDWPVKRAIQIERAGVQELELDPATFAYARQDLGDLRVVRGGNQIPYLLENPFLGRSLSLNAANVPDAKRPTVSVWRIDLPNANLPADRLVFTSTTALFQREFRVYEKLADQNGQVHETTLASGAWSRTPDPGVPETRTFELHGRVQADTLWIETDNGDNPPIALGTAQVIYGVRRLIFKTADTDGFTLVYGNPLATAPRYDLSLVAAKLLTSPRNPARLVASGATPAGHRAFYGISGGVIFWGALGLVVVVLLVVVAKLLPKPTQGN